MEIIGEKINGSRKGVAEAIARRDADAIRSLACKQSVAGVAWLDVHAATLPEQEPADLVWLVEQVQAAVDTPLCLDSVNPTALSRALTLARAPALINSINADPQILNSVLPLAAQYKCKVIGLALNGKKIPPTIQERLDLIHSLIDAARAAGIPDKDIYIDPLLPALSTNQEGGRLFLTILRTIRSLYPEVHCTAGLSNLSFGLPGRALLHRTFLPLALEAGLDSAILDPLDQELMHTILAAELVLGRDRNCLNYIRAHRAGNLLKSAK